MNIVFTIKVKIIMLIKYRSPQLCWLSSLEWLSFFSLQSNLFQMHGLLVSILGTTLNHMLLKYRCPNMNSNEIRGDYLNRKIALFFQSLTNFRCCFLCSMFLHQIELLFRRFEMTCVSYVCQQVCLHHPTSMPMTSWTPWRRRQQLAPSRNWYAHKTITCIYENVQK